jgi:hypothetical protein
MSLSNDIVQKSGMVCVEGQIFDLNSVGLYRFYRLPDFSEQRIVGVADFELLKNVIGSIWSYGFEYFLPRNIEFAIDRAKNCIIIAGCVDISRLAEALLKRFGVKSRFVALKTLDPWGGQDDGHTVLEIYSKNREWVLYDPSFGLMFASRGRYLSAYEVCISLRTNNFSIEYLPRSLSHGSFRHSNFDYGFWIDEKYHSVSVMESWYKNIAHVPIYSIGDKMIFPSELCTSDDVIRLLSCGYSALNSSEFFQDIYEK